MQRFTRIYGGQVIHGNPALGFAAPFRTSCKNTTWLLLAKLILMHWNYYMQMENARRMITECECLEQSLSKETDMGPVIAIRNIPEAHVIMTFCCAEITMHVY